MASPDFDITPSPRVLSLLGQIQYATWQCIAELVDNSVDAFVSAYAARQGFLFPSVEVSFPTRSQLGDPDAAIEVIDNGPGMSPEDLERAVKAGYSGNDPISKLGLFGMGFNIATARLGRRTEVWTTRTEDSVWTGVAVDFDELIKRQAFSAPRLVLPKTAAERDYHGTKVKIQKLDVSKTGDALRNRNRIREQLSKTYSKVIQQVGLQVTIDGQPITAHRFCTWDAGRSVVHKDLGSIPAIIPVEHDFGTRVYCTTCWVWLEPNQANCQVCGEQGGLRERTRKLKGWIGVQRFFDKDDFGFDLTRNGRAIVLRSKRFFSWSDPNDGREIPEYPIDGALGGRLVGELEMDFVPVTYQKDSFEWNSPEFKVVYDYLHGAGPILPDIASKLGFDDSPSPLRQLHGAYRNAYPAGLRHLIPGDATGKVINKEAQDWASLFQRGDAEYQDDRKWYEAVILADEALRKTSTSSKTKTQPQAPGGNSSVGDLPFLDASQETSGAGPDRRDGPEAGTEGASNDVRSGTPVQAETGSTQSRLESEDPSLSNAYKLKLGAVDVEFKVTAFIVHSTLPDGRRCSVQVAGNIMEFRFQPDHPDYRAGSASWLDDQLVEVAYQLRERARMGPADVSLGEVVLRLKAQYHETQLIDVIALKSRADAFAKSMTSALVVSLAEHQPVRESDVTPEERREIQNYVVRRERMGVDRVEEIIRTGEFPRYLPLQLVPPLIRRFPWAFGDRRFFVFPHEGLDLEAQQAWIDQAMGCLIDVTWLLSDSADGLPESEYRMRLQRCAISMDLLESWRVD